MSQSYFLPVNSLTISNRIVAGSLSTTRVPSGRVRPAVDEGALTTPLPSSCGEPA